MIKVLFFVLMGFPVCSFSSVELESPAFFVCIRKQATAVESRTIGVYQFAEENKCAVVYSIGGQDQMVSRGRWLSFCNKKAQQVVGNLQEGLWKCHKQNKVQTVYSTASSSLS